MRRQVLLLAGAAALAAVAFSGDRFWLQFLGKAMIGCILAIGLDLLVGFTGLVSLAHSAFFGLAAYALALLTNRLGLVNPLATLPLCVAFAAAAALVIGWLSLRATGVYFIMVTLAFTQMLFFFFNDSPGLGGSDGLYVQERPVDSRLAAYLAIWVALIAVYLVLSRVLRAPYGRVLEGIRGNEQRMRSLGYPTRRYKLVAFVIAGATAGVAGYLDATLYGFVNPAQLGWRQSGLILVTVLLGGKGTLYGPAFGALLLAFIEHYGEQVTEHWNALIAALVIAVVLFLPRGLAGLLQGNPRG
ncbi:MAG: branched-chain amino acid ABC transporter permease [Myxococcales bacterium]